MEIQFDMPDDSAQTILDNMAADPHAALLAVQKLLKKTPGSAMLKLVKAYALAHKKGSADQLKLANGLLDGVLATNPSDDGLLCLAMDVLRALDRESDIPGMYERAFAGAPHDLALGRWAFVQLVRAPPPVDWKRAHLAATRLYRASQDEKHCWWSMCAAVLQTEDPATPAETRTVLLKLVLRLVDLVPTASWLRPRRLMLHADVLGRLGRARAALLLLERPEGKLLCAQNTTAEAMRLRLALQAGNWRAEGERARASIQEGNAPWTSYETYIICALHQAIPPPDYTEPFSSPSSSRASTPDPEGQRERLLTAAREAAGFLLGVADAQDPARAVSGDEEGARDDLRELERGPLLALLTLEQHVRAYDFGEGRGVSCVDLVHTLRRYITAFAGHSACVEDVRPFVGALDVEERARLREWVELLPCDVRTRDALRRTINTFAIQRALEESIPAFNTSERGAAPPLPRTEELGRQLGNAELGRPQHGDGKQAQRTHPGKRLVETQTSTLGLKLDALARSDKANALGLVGAEYMDALDHEHEQAALDYEHDPVLQLVRQGGETALLIVDQHQDDKHVQHQDDGRAQRLAHQHLEDKELTHALAYARTWRYAVRALAGEGEEGSIVATSPAVSLCRSPGVSSGRSPAGSFVASPAASFAALWGTSGSGSPSIGSVLRSPSMASSASGGRLTSSTSGDSLRVPASESSGSRRLTKSDSGGSLYVPASESGGSQRLTKSDSGGSLAASESGRRLAKSDSGGSLRVPASESLGSQRLTKSDSGGSLAASDSGSSQRLVVSKSDGSLSASGSGERPAASDAGGGQRLAAADSGDGQRLAVATSKERMSQSDDGAVATSSESNGRLATSHPDREQAAPLLPTADAESYQRPRAFASDDQQHLVEPSALLDSHEPAAARHIDDDSKHGAAGFGTALPALPPALHLRRASLEDAPDAEGGAWCCTLGSRPHSPGELLEDVRERPSSRVAAIAGADARDTGDVGVSSDGGDMTLPGDGADDPAMPPIADADFDSEPPRNADVKLAVSPAADSDGALLVPRRLSVPRVCIEDTDDEDGAELCRPARSAPRTPGVIIEEVSPPKILFLREPGDATESDASRAREEKMRARLEAMSRESGMDEAAILAVKSMTLVEMHTEMMRIYCERDKAAALERKREWKRWREKEKEGKGKEPLPSFFARKDPSVAWDDYKYDYDSDELPPLVPVSSLPKREDSVPIIRTDEVADDASLNAAVPNLHEPAVAHEHIELVDARGELHPADDLAMLSAQAFVRAWKISGDPAYLLPAVCVLEAALRHSPNSYALRLHLVRVYRLLGCGAGLALEHYTKITVGKAEAPTMAHWVLERAGAFAYGRAPSTGKDKCKNKEDDPGQRLVEMCKRADVDSKHMADVIVSLFLQEQYETISDMVTFRERLERSLHEDLIVIERMRIKLLGAAQPKVVLIEGELKEMKNMLDYKAHDTRDVSLLRNYQPVGDASFAEQTSLGGVGAPGAGWRTAFVKLYLRTFATGDDPTLPERVGSGSEAELAELTTHERGFVAFVDAVRAWLTAGAREDDAEEFVRGFEAEAALCEKKLKDGGILAGEILHAATLLHECYVFFNILTSSLGKKAKKKSSVPIRNVRARLQEGIKRVAAGMKDCAASQTVEFYTSHCMVVQDIVPITAVLEELAKDRARAFSGLAGALLRACD